MTDINPPFSKNAGTPSDLVSLADIAGDGTPAPAAPQDSILNAAHEFEVQLEQMSAWKHQLAQQMEVMRRDGIKLLERQKSLALEKKKIGEERDALTKERQHLETLHRELTEGTKALRAKEEELAAARGELQKLQSERSRWEEEMRSAQGAAQNLENRKSEINAAIAAAEARLQEIQGLLGQRDDLQNQVNGAREALAGIEQQRGAAEGKLHELSLAQAELQAKERALAEQEARRLEQDVQLRSALEQLEQQRRELAESQRAVQHERENLGQQNAERAGQLESRERELAGREEQLAATKRAIEQQQAQINGQQEQVQQQQRDLAQKKIGIDEELQARLDAAEKSKKQMEEERTTLLKQRRDLEKKLDEMEQELSGQLEALAKQTKRLTERRADLDHRTEELEKEYTQRLERETGTLRDELAAKERAYEKRIALVQQQLEQTQAGASDVQGREAALRSQLDAAGEKIAAGQKELTRLSAELEEVNRDRAAQGNLLKEQVRRYEQDLAEWQRKLDATTAQGSQAAGAASTEVSTIKQALAEARAELEQTRGRLAEAEAQKRAWEEKAGAPAENPAQVMELKAQIEMLEKQRIDLAGQIFTVQDAMRRHSEDAMLAKNVMESELIELRRRHAALEAERKSWQSTPPTPRSTQPGSQGGVSAEEAERAQQALAAHREKLLQQARTLRAHKRQSRESAATLDQNRQDIAQQREQLRSRKENLEQVKRLLEKQEMVMARKLADHNALKTVAAVGIFVIMVLGSTFIGVYKFANPTYRSEAVVQLAPGQEVAGNDLQAWMARQMEFMRSEDVTFAAWKALRSPENHYAMQDGRDEWLTSLGKNLVMQIDPTTKTLTVRYAGPIAEGVSQVCNALATAYTNPGTRDTGKPENKQMGAGASLVAPATIPAFPAEDNRMTLSLSVVAVVLFVSLLLVIVFRHYVARQLREIDQMADEQDLEDIQAEMPADVNPA